MYMYNIKTNSCLSYSCMNNPTWDTGTSTITGITSTLEYLFPNDEKTVGKFSKRPFMWVDWKGSVLKRMSEMLINLVKTC